MYTANDKPTWLIGKPHNWDKIFGPIVVPIRQE